MSENQSRLQHFAETGLLDIGQVIAFVLGVALSLIAGSMSLKQAPINRKIPEMSDEDLQDIQADVWFGISRQANDYVLFLAAAMFAGSIALAWFRRKPFHIVVCVLSGLALGTAAAFRLMAL